MNAAIAAERLRRQLLMGAGLRRPADVVAWFGAMQAQEYEHAKWALGLRLRDGIVAADIERAFQDGHILRTHVLRPTWHFVTPSDIRWLLELTGPRIQRRMAVYNGHLGLAARTFARALRVMERALRDGRFLTRGELGERLQRAGLPLTSMQLAHVAMHAEVEGVICSGPRRGKQFTYALLAERAPNASRLPRDEALAALGRRFFRSHGPATIRDFVWWSGLSTADARRSLEIIDGRREEVDGRMYWTCDREPRGAMRDHLAHLLPIYDEYVVAYRDRLAVPPRPQTTGPTKPWSTFQHALVIAGQVAGTWRLERGPQSVQLDAVSVRRVTRPERAALAQAVRRYEAFLSTPVSFSLS
jgi:hypothetical protein